MAGGGLNSWRAACLALVGAALASCGPGHADKPPAPAAPSAPAPPPPPPSPAQMQADLATAKTLPKNQPNFHVCLPSARDKDGAPPMVVPAGTLFISWGKKNGDERNPRLDTDMLKPGSVRWVVVISRPLTLSRAQPCGDTVGQVGKSGLYEWYQPLVRKSQDLQFAVTGVENHMAFPVGGRLGDLVKTGEIFGYPTADIGNPRMLREDE